MQIRIFLQIPEYSGVRDKYFKNKIKIALTSQYYTYFSGSHDEVVCILFSIKIHVSKDMNNGHHVCGVLDYNTGTWLRCGNGIINIYSGYPENVCNDLSQ